MPEQMEIVVRLNNNPTFILKERSPTAVVNLSFQPSLVGDVSLTGPAGTPSIKGVNLFLGGFPQPDEPICAIAPYDFIIANNASFAEALVAATAETIFIIENEGVQIGTVTFAPNSTEGVIVLTDPNISKGDLITIVAPTVVDATLSYVTFLLAS